MAEIVLNGITWAHSRGITPLLAAAQRFSELHPGITINWKKRSLQEFADYPLEKLTAHYDLLIIDHPWVGCAAAKGAALPLNEYLSPDYLRNQAGNSTGDSHESYIYDGHQWALAIDAAAPAASYRADLLQKNNVRVPQTWQELMQLAKQGRVAIPAIPIDLLMNFYMFCLAHGETPFLQSEVVVSKETGIKALETMHSLYALIDKQFFRCNPIDVAELMSSTNDFWYCPFAYCYSNYARNGFAKYTLHYTDLVSFNGSGTLRSTIGGTGIAVSSTSAHKKEAVEFSAWICSPEIQRTLYVQHGGQPGHRSAWTDEQANTLTNNFFKNLLPAMDRGYMRPRYNGYLHFQDEAGQPLQEYLLGRTSAESVLQKMNIIYKQSQSPNPDTLHATPETPNPKPETQNY